MKSLNSSIYEPTRLPNRVVPVKRPASPSAPASRPHARRESQRAPTGENLIGRIGLPLWFAGLMAAALWFDSPAGAWMPGIAVGDLRSVGGVLRITAHVAATLAPAFVRYVPLGLLAVFALPARRRFWKRIVHVGVPAFTIAACLAAVVVETDARGLRTAAAADLLFACVCCSVGVWVGAAWLRGPRARLLIVPTLLAAAMALPAALGLFVYATLEPDPLRLDVPTLTSESRRHLFHVFAGKNPKKLAPGTSATLFLSERDLNELLAWAASTVADRHQAQVDLSGPSPALLISALSPIHRGDAKYLNIILEGGVRIDHGTLGLEIRRLRVGSLDVPASLLRIASPIAAALANNSWQLQPLIAPVDELQLKASGLSTTYGRVEVPSGVVASLFKGDDVNEFQGAVWAHARHLLTSDARLADPEARFGASLETAFRYARERSALSDPVTENEAAIVALGLLLGHPKVERLIGRVLDESDFRAAAAFQKTTVRSRPDWTQHYLISATISVLSTQGLSDSTGLLKEELDADGGSGFSFGDLAADRAGTTFALAATHDAAAARAMQDRLRAGFRTDDFFPIATDLPETMSQAELTRRFGGVEGALFRGIVAEIDRRIGRCAAFQGASFSPAIFNQQVSR